MIAIMIGPPRRDMRLRRCSRMLVPMLADGIRRCKDAVVDRLGFSNKANSLPLGLWDKSNNLTHVFTPVVTTIVIPSGQAGPLTPTSTPRAGGDDGPRMGAVTL
jgi:hypothetical protein